MKITEINERIEKFFAAVIDHRWGHCKNHWEKMLPEEKKFLKKRCPSVLKLCKDVIDV